MISFADLPLILSLPALVVASAVCSSSETVLFSLTHGDRVRLRRTHPRIAEGVTTLLSRPRRLLVLLLMLNTTVNVLYFVLSTLLAERLGGAGAVLLSVLALLVLIPCGELLPKSLGAVHRVTFARVLVPFVLAASRIFGPICSFLDSAIVRPITLIARPESADRAAAIAPDELSALLEAGARRGVIDEGEQQLLSDVVALRQTRVRDVMTPRVEVKWVDRHATPDQVRELVRDCGHSKLPVCVDSLDGGVLGMLFAKPYLSAHVMDSLGTDVTAGAHARPIAFVPQGARLDQLLELFRTKHIHVAMCVDEHGAVMGLVEVEDVIRSLVAGAGPSAEGLESGVTALSVGEWLVPGRLGVRQWEQFFGGSSLRPASGREQRVSTVGGLIVAKLGRLPKRGDVVHIGNVSLTVESMEGRVVDQVRVSVSQEEMS